MTDTIKANTELNTKIEKIEKEVQPALYEKSLDHAALEEVAEKDLNSMILNITLKIKDHYPELSKYLEELPVTIPDAATPEINEKNLQAYYDSLNEILKKYQAEHPETTEPTRSIEQ